MCSHGGQQSFRQQRAQRAIGECVFYHEVRQDGDAHAGHDGAFYGQQRAHAQRRRHAYSARFAALRCRLRVVRTNNVAPWLTLKHFAPLMRRGGSIVFNSSVNNQLGMPGSSVYAATKAAVRSLVRVAASKFAEAGVRVNAVSPGPIDPPLYGKLGMPPEVVQGFASGLVARIPLKRFGTSDEVAKAALFLASDDSSFMTGEEIVLDGGMTRV